MLVHICCAVDSHYFLQRLREDFPNEELIGLFYDPNIHPYSEYRLRLLEVERSCRELKIPLIEGEYNFQDWLERVKGLEREPEKGKRCAVCFDYRFEESARVSAKLNQKSFTSTLLTSPKKSIAQLQKEGERVAQKYGVEFITVDYREASGTQRQNRMVKESKIYRQDYCGCIYGVTIQREEQERLADELLSPISSRVEPESIEYRLKLYKERLKLEERGIDYEIIRERFLNYRLKYALLKVKKEKIPSHILPYSKLKRGFTRGSIQKSIGENFYLNRDEVIFITLERFNRLAEREYKSIRELIYNPPSFKEELEIRDRIIKSRFSLSAIVVVEEIPKKRIDLIIDSVVYEDSIERLIEL